MTTLEQLQGRITKLQKQAEELMRKKASSVIADIRKMMAEHGLTTADIEAHVVGKNRGPKPGAKAAAVVKVSVVTYQDPKTGATWSGRGRAPSWIAGAKDRTKFMVDGSAAISAAPVANRAKAVGNYVRGPQPAKYLDPKSGATWSGRGPAPAWLADAKDRAKFLIGIASAPVDAGAASKTKPSAKTAVAKNAVVKKVAATKTAPMKKVAVKKVVAKKAVSAKVPAKKAPAKKAPRQSVAVPAPVAAVESGAELTT